MTDTPNPITIDFAKVLAGYGYPQDSVTVNLNQKVAYSIHRLLTTLATLDEKKDKDEIAGIEASLEKLKEEAKKSEYTFHLKGVDRQLRSDLTEQIRAEFDVKTDMFGRTESNPEAQLAFASRLWALHTERIDAPEGVMEAPTPESLVPILKSGADLAIAQIDAKITEVQSEGATDGFQALIRDADFLSQR